MIPVVRPVARGGIVQSEMDDYPVAGEVECRFVFFLLAVRAMSFVEQRGTAFTEIHHFVAVSQHALQLSRIRIDLPVLYACTVCHAITYTSYLNLILTVGSCAK